MGGRVELGAGRWCIWCDGIQVRTQIRRGTSAVGFVYDDHVLCGMGALVIGCMVGVWGQRSFGVESEVDTLSRFAGFGNNLVPVLLAESRDVGVESPLHASFDIGAKMICMRHGHGAGLIRVVAGMKGGEEEVESREKWDLMLEVKRLGCGVGSTVSRHHKCTIYTLSHGTLTTAVALTLVANLDHKCGRSA